MKLPDFIGNSIFKKLMFLMFLVAAVPIGSSLIYFLYLGKGLVDSSKLTLVYYGMFLLTIAAAAAGAYYISMKLSRPITHFIDSARDIARGNFSHKIKVESSDEIGRLAKIFNYMTTELRRLDEMNLNKIINEKNKTETILRNIADGVIVTDPGNRVLLVNSVVEAWFNISVEKVTDQQIDSLMKDPKLVRFIHGVASKNSSDMVGIEVTVVPQEVHKEVVLQARAARIVSEKKELIGVVTVLRDITREKEIDRLKTELVSMVAHELRSPLTSISGFSELLLDDGVTREQAEEYASIILNESNRLNDLINKFLDISKIESGKSQVRKSPVDLRSLLEKIIDFNGQLAKKKQIEVSLESPPKVTAIMADRDMMEQVFLNLFSNAVKYSPEKAEVMIRLHESDDEMTVEVQDTGYGISPESLPRIFDKFYRVTDNADLMDVTGSGLGLALVKEIIEIHGGSIRVESKLGKGSNFITSLPKVEEDVEEEQLSQLVA